MTAAPLFWFAQVGDGRQRAVLLTVIAVIGKIARNSKILKSAQKWLWTNHPSILLTRGNSRVFFLTCRVPPGNGGEIFQRCGLRTARNSFRRRAVVRHVPWLSQFVENSDGRTFGHHAEKPEHFRKALECSTQRLLRDSTCGRTLFRKIAKTMGRVGRQRADENSNFQFEARTSGQFVRRSQGGLDT